MKIPITFQSIISPSTSERARAVHSACADAEIRLCRTASSAIEKREYKSLEKRKERANERTRGFVKTRNCIFHAGRHQLSFCIRIFPVDIARIADSISDRKKKGKRRTKSINFPVTGEESSFLERAYNMYTFVDGLEKILMLLKRCT